MATTIQYVFQLRRRKAQPFRGPARCRREVFSWKVRLDEEKASAGHARSTSPTLAEAVGSAAVSLRNTTEWLIGQDANDRFAVAVPFLRAAARVIGPHCHLKAALADPGSARTALARFYIQRLLPEHAALLTQIRQGGAGLFDLSPDDLAS